jgi:hypothetical protein
LWNVSPHWAVRADLFRSMQPGSFVWTEQAAS